ncbi:uncharacterized protein LOC143920080 [Arctopsyche grandis]|uniref:uncharacterized protein LOC143920080 n=1 Tax=Arctopsyche grandis TaxID=121162 RepID=UPI00406D8DF0
MLKIVLLIMTFLYWKTLACDCDSCNKYLETGQQAHFQSDIIGHSSDVGIDKENNPWSDLNNSENYSSLIYIYNLSLYYWELLKSYRNHIQYVQNMLNFREHLEDSVDEHSLTHLPNSYSLNKPADSSDKTNSVLKNSNNALKTLEATKKLEKLCPNPASQHVNSQSQSPDCDALTKDQNTRDTIARLRLVGLSFLDMGHLLLQDDPHYPIIPKHSVKKVEYIYPRANES